MARNYSVTGKRESLPTQEVALILCRKKRRRIVINNDGLFELQNLKGKIVIPGTLEIRLWSKIVELYNTK